MQIAVLPSPPGSGKGQVVVFSSAIGALKAVVRNDRLILDEPTDLPEGAQIEVALVTDNADGELLAELNTSAGDEKAGRLVDMTDVLARLGSRP